MSKTMTAIEVEGGKGPAEALKPVQVPLPTPKAGQVLIRVRAAGLNRADVAQRQGSYPPPPGESEVLGMEVAGEIIEGAGRWKPGDRVCALLGGGGYAQYAVCDARHALPIPAGMDFAAAAALPETVITVYANVFEHAAFKSGETFMVHGATSGIGVTAIQMVKRAGGKVIATGRGADKAAAARALGADVAVDATSEDFAAVAKAQGGVDVILEMVGGDYFKKDLDSLKTGGRIAFIAAPAGGDLALPIWTVIRKRAVVTGSTLRARSPDEKARLVAEVERVVWPWVTAGEVKPVVHRTFPLAEAAQAQAFMEAGAYVGKIILTVD
jgi:NADPH2:quinone reductase